MKLIKIIYWVSTSIIILMIGAGSFADIFMIDAMRQSIKLHGFPEYVLPYFGITKLLATFKRYKEVAYSGLFFYFVGAVYSHLAIGDSFARTASAIIPLAAVIVSYLCWLKLEGTIIKQRKTVNSI